ncbi:MAG: Asp-tRNA(Asn)/Glu-tRNA(Gln) amidotransferase subunit GatC [Opitutales bacterium]
MPLPLAGRFRSNRPETKYLSNTMSDADFNINYIARLARIELSEEEKERFGKQLADVLGYFEKLKQVDVDGVEPMAHAHAVFNVWREGDEPGPTLDAADVMRHAPAHRENQIVVPKVVE